MFDFFKKKEKKEELHYDPTNIKVTDLRIGFLLDYADKTWEVADEFEYDWGDNFITFEYKLIAGDEAIYMRVEESDKVYCIFTQKVRFAKLGSNVEEHLKKHHAPPSQIDYDGIKYYKNSESPGYFRSTQDEDSVEILTWDYFDDSEQHVLLIDQWGDNDFESSVGIIQNQDVVSNILPR